MGDKRVSVAEEWVCREGCCVRCMLRWGRRKAKVESGKVVWRGECELEDVVFGVC